MAASELLPKPWQVFINFRGVELRNNFISHLEEALAVAGINYYIGPSEDLSASFAMIKQSEIALPIFSSKYAESNWCLDELVKITQQFKKGKLRIIPVFFNVTPEEVREQKGEFGLKLYGGSRRNQSNIKDWENALQSVPSKFGVNRKEYRNERDFVNSILGSIKEVLSSLPPPVNRGTSYGDTDNSSGPSFHFNPRNADKIFAEFFESDIGGGGNASRTFANSRMDDEVNTPRTQDSAEIREEELRYGFVSRLVMALKSNKIRSHLGMKIGCLFILFFCLQQIAYRSISFIDRGGTNRIVKYIPTKGTENPRDKDTEFPTCKVGANPKTSSSDATRNDDFFDRTCNNSPMNVKVKPPNIQVFINFRGDQLRNNFVGYLVDALQRREINVFIDNQEKRGEDLITLFQRIEDSGIAIVVFSSRYTESKWCLEELVKIKERVHQGLLKVTPTNVKRLKGEFGDHFRDKEYMYESDEPMIKRWKEAILFVSHKFALTLDEKSSTLEINFVETIVKEVLKMLQAISKVQSSQSS
ncbi:PREDICTED: uncharacterized protein LOC104760403 isoform X2 [Camelina sativa]|uniref:Uncharacterized protein LOC104760403 isoform X2 n=1 Tax=Camelina sativa TaxID=90675 RepID=A0ABM0X6W6_CAMSA|nr:PREDICTED: uncharacterized protein LOC104760403 isoform X2 [Camelina sativa]